MSQAHRIPTFPTAHPFPPLAYKGTPVLTTEMLAQAYEVTPKQIRQNFANNRDRFIEGKHFFSVSGQELKDFRLCVENFDSQISTKVRVLILYTNRGCARHAKSLNTDRAWDMYELLEETFFAVVKTDHPVTLNDTTRPSRRTDPERKALTAIINTWVGMAPIHYASARSQVNAHFGVASVDALTIGQVSDAIQWVQEKIDALQQALPQATLPSLCAAHPVIDEKPFLEFIEEIQAAHEEVDRILSRLHHSVFTLSWKVAEALERRADIRLYLVPDMLSENTLRGYLHQSVYHDVRKALTAPGRQLEQYSNPGYSLLGIVRQLNGNGRA